MNKTLFLDFDGTVVNSKKRLAEIYNRYYLSQHDNPIDWERITTWSAGISDGEIVEEIFGHKNFHNDELEIFEDCLDTLKWMKLKGWKIVLYTKGTISNIHYKSDFVHRNLDEILDGWIFIGAEGVPMGKSMYDMSPQEEGDITVIIDDHIKNLKCGAQYDICAKLCGDDEEWNSDWDGKFINHWKELPKIIKLIEQYEFVLDEINNY